MSVKALASVRSFSSPLCLVLTPRDSSSLSHNLYFSGCSALAKSYTWVWSNIPIESLVHKSFLSIRVVFLFVFPQFPSSIDYYSTLITSHIRRIASCSKLYLWIVDLEDFHYLPLRVFSCSLSVF